MLNADQIKVGEQYIMVERPFYKAVVTVVADESKPGWHGWRVRFEHGKGGMVPKVGAEISVGWDTDYQHYSPVEFRPMDEESL